MQLVSVTGMWGITFLLVWFASIVNYAWERSFSWSEIRRGVALYVGVMLAVIAYGNIRLAFSQPEAGTMRVHGITVVDMRENWVRLLKVANNDGWDVMRAQSAAYQEEYFQATIREAKAGAQLVLWPEMAVMVATEDEPNFLARAGQIAQQESIYLAVGMGTIYADETPHEVKLLLFDPDGKLVLEHYKYGGQSVEGFKPGDGVLRTAVTPFGTISGLHLLGQPTSTRQSLQAGRNGTDILLSPSLEFRAIDPHACPNGDIPGYRKWRLSSSVRQTMGLSIVTDPFGRTLAAMDHFTAAERVMVAQVPSHGVWTLYSVIGDLFGWLAVVGMVAIVAAGLLRGRRTEPVAVPSPA